MGIGIWSLEFVICHLRHQRIHSELEALSLNQRTLWIKRILTFVVGAIIWHLPIPWDITPDAWHLFAIFITAIIGVLLEAFSIFTASIIALVFAVLLRVLTPSQAYSGFSESFILLILAAFLVAKGVIKSGLGRRIAFMLIRRFGKSTLNLGYCLIVTDTIIGPTIPSNTARSWSCSGMCVRKPMRRARRRRDCRPGWTRSFTV